MQNARTQSDREHIEEIIHQVRGVLSAYVSITQEGEVEEIHVLGDAERTPKQIVRDIESMLVTQLGLRIDHKRVSVAQMRKSGKIPQTRAITRLKFRSVNLTVTGVAAEAQVEVERDEVVSTGIASGPSSTQNQMRLVASASLRAFEKFFPPDHSLALEELKVIPLGGEKIIVIIINLLQPREEIKLIGSSIMGSDVKRSVIFATLKALNRYIGKIEREQRE
ncbi:hypothetical protein KAX22_07325 [bacterium]|nr:hypothetical protein [bacterium]